MRPICAWYLWLLPFATLVLLADARPASATHACYANFVNSDVKTGNNAPQAP
jgi:hypothetical protein